jgi:hypothetical protein
MKNTKTLTIAALLVAVVLAPLFAFKGQQAKTETVIETKCFVHHSMNQIKFYVDCYSMQGYTVKQITSQSISTSIDEAYRNSGGGNYYRDVKGDIILILEKQKTITHK